jgi:hypothetical protein
VKIFISGEEAGSSHAAITQEPGIIEITESFRKTPRGRTQIDEYLLQLK